MQKVTPFLWFSDNAEEAIELYTSLFEDAKVHHLHRVGPEDKLMTATFEVGGQRFIALNGGPHYTFSPAISLFVNCEDQQEIDEKWEKLSEGGQVMQCGWLTDRFGVTWQIVPRIFNEYMSDPNPAKSQAVMTAMMRMIKFDIAKLTEAYEQA
jgi:predicted 3-demethylubiquinone-9 3-methyltransferase (glyoxalase superfamily)